MNPNLKFATAPVPKLPETTLNWASPWVEGVSSQSPSAKKTAAEKLLTFLNQKDTLRNLYAAESKERLIGEIFARTDMADQLATDPIVGSFVTEAQRGKSWYLSSRTFDNGPNDQIIKYYEDAINAVIGGMEPSKALATAELGIQQVMDKFNLPKP